ncbi:MAG: hypothetical protein DDT31_01011 [Syntrophomonadaceae bacterium]|nr:hypothetical protein [Bacillota bacterium]
MLNNNYYHTQTGELVKCLGKEKEGFLFLRRVGRRAVPFITKNVAGWKQILKSNLPITALSVFENNSVAVVKKKTTYPFSSSIAGRYKEVI